MTQEGITKLRMIVLSLTSLHTPIFFSYNRLADMRDLSACAGVNTMAEGGMHAMSRLGETLHGMLETLCLSSMSACADLSCRMVRCNNIPFGLCPKQQTLMHRAFCTCQLDLVCDH